MTLIEPLTLLWGIIIIIISKLSPFFVKYNCNNYDKFLIDNLRWPHSGQLRAADFKAILFSFQTFLNLPIRAFCFNFPPPLRLNISFYTSEVVSKISYAPLYSLRWLGVGSNKLSLSQLQRVSVGQFKRGTFFFISFFRYLSYQTSKGPML